MIGKKYSLGDTFEATGEPLVKIANFEKLAEEDGQDVQSFIKSFKPDSRYLYLHVIAMSSGEHYGCNINGDYFPEADLIARHKTFETQAKVFKEHDNKPYSQSYGYVPFAWYNMKMHRVELILAIDKVAGKEFVIRVERGERLAVSMGTKVRYDICSICGNHASKPHEYCEHIRLHKKEVFPDGRQAYMINPNPTFFDISIVRKPADKTAYQLAKVASTESIPNSYNEELVLEFENLDSYFPVEEKSTTWEIVDDEILSNDIKKVATIESTIDKLEKIALDKYSPAIAVKAVNEDLHDFLPAMEALEPDLPDSLLKHLANKFSIDDILRSFLGSAIPMKPREFTKIIIIKKGLPKEALDPLLEGVLKASPAKHVSGLIRPEIRSSLAPFIHNRSSILIDIVDKLKRIFGDDGFEKHAASWYQPNPVMEMLDQDPRMNFGYVRRVPDYMTPAGDVPADTVFVRNKGLNQIIPMALSPEAAAIEAQRPSMSVVDRNQLIALGSIVGSNYQAYKNPELVYSILREPDILSSLALVIGAAKNVKDVIFGNKDNKEQPKSVKVTTTVKKASDGYGGDGVFSRNPIEDLVLEHLVNSHIPEREPVINVIKLGTEVNDATQYLAKTASVDKKKVKNAAIDAAEWILLPAFMARKAPGSIATTASYMADNAILNSFLE